MAAGAIFEPGSESDGVRSGLELPQIVIENTMPVINFGQKPAKAVAGQLFKVTSHVYCLTSGPLAVIVRWRQVDSSDGDSLHLHTLGDRVWNGQILIDQPGPHVFCIDAWIDSYGGYCLALEKALQTGEPLQSLIDTGLAHIVQALGRCDEERQHPLKALHHHVRRLSPPEQVACLMNERTKGLMRDAQPRTCLTLSPEYPLYVVR
ncbi:hypothetical protein CJF36_15105 [Pseudomonas lundensis]|nr:hypothetical protein CJF36_15105 [Pseudomonas lundensis]